MTTPPRRPSAAARATRRSRQASRSATFIERNRNRLIVGAAAVIFAILVGMAFLNASQPAYACSVLFDPTPAPTWVAPSAAPVASGASPAPAVTPPPPGYVQPDMGHLHVTPGTRVRYTNCPPASGKHYNATGLGPIKPGLYGPDDQQAPQGWVHNMEHGGIVLLYNCGPEGDPAACTEAGQSALKALYAKWPASPVCKIPAGALVAPVIARFDDMAYPFAAVVWDVVLPMQTIDETELFDFYARQGEQFAPEIRAICALPTPTPGPATPTPVPTATTAPTTAPTAAPTTAPASAASTPAAS